QELKIEKREVKFTEGEIARLQVAIEKAAKEIENIREKTLKEMGEDEAQIFEAHLMLLQDPEFFDQTKSLIEQSNVNAEYAFYQVREQFVSTFENMENEYMRERAADIKDISNRVLKHLLGIPTQDLSRLDEEVILIAHDLTPSDTAC